jgi:hypothetical protein
MPDTTSAEIANLAASEKVSLTHARVIARDFEAWVQTQPQAPVGGKVKRGIGLGTLLKIGSMVLVMIPRLMALAAGAVLVQTFTLLGQPRWIAIGTGTPPNIPGAQ